MRELVETAITLASNHPLMALSLLMFGAFPLVLGWLHESRFVTECAIVAIRFVKHECQEWRATIVRIRRELSSWEDGEEKYR